jgi:hypothetical protein
VDSVLAARFPDPVKDDLAWEHPAPVRHPAWSRMARPAAQFDAAPAEPDEEPVEPKTGTKC